MGFLPEVRRNWGYLAQRSSGEAQTRTDGENLRGVSSDVTDAAAGRDIGIPVHLPRGGPSGRS
ncbi:hypothetical protein CEQ30_01250 [Nocardia brasiliensis]|nr:hypothetical protein CEQ30_01250 [Nocardia brasiliensis]